MVLRVAALLLLATVVDGRGRAGKPGGTKKDPEANNHLQQVRLLSSRRRQTRLPAAAPPRGPQRLGLWLRLLTRAAHRAGQAFG